MMNRELLNKLMSEVPLSIEEQALLDAALSEQKGGLQSYVACLTDDEPGLSWRSALDERLMSLRPADEVRANELDLEVSLDSAEHRVVASWVEALPEETPSMQWRSALNERLASLRPSAAMDAEKVDLEVGLDSAEHARIASWVQALPEDEPSMTWRSALNEKLHAMRPTPRRKPFWSAWRLASAGAVAVAGALAVGMFIMTPKQTPSKGGSTTSDSVIEARLIAAHQESTGALDLGANNVLPLDGNYKAVAPSVWNDADLDTL